MDVPTRGYLQQSLFSHGCYIITIALELLVVRCLSDHDADEVTAVVIVIFYLVVL